MALLVKPRLTEGKCCSLIELWEGKGPLAENWTKKRIAKQMIVDEKLLDVVRNIQETKRSKSFYLALSAELIVTYDDIITEDDIKKEISETKGGIDLERIKTLNSAVNFLDPKSAYMPGCKTENMTKMYAISLFKMTTSAEKCVRIFIDLHERKNIDFVQCAFANERIRKQHCVILFGVNPALAKTLEKRVSKSRDMNSLFERLFKCDLFKDVVLFDPACHLAFGLKDKPEVDKFVTFLNKDHFDNVKEITTPIGNKYLRIKSAALEVFKIFSDEYEMEEG